MTNLLLADTSQALLIAAGICLAAAAFNAQARWYLIAAGLLLFVITVLLQAGGVLP